MTTVWKAAQDISSNAVEQLEWEMKNDHISCVFGLDDFISEQISEYVGNLIYTHEINELWIDLGCPEPEEMCESISASIVFAIHCELASNERVQDDVRMSINQWAVEKLETEHPEIDLSDIDEDDTEEMIRALS